MNKLLGRLFWVDEEETVAFPDIAYLRYQGYQVDLIGSAGEAVDWFNTEKSSLEDYLAFVIDVQLPSNGDNRFHDAPTFQGAFTGLKVCELVKMNVGAELWGSLRSRFVLYTRLPDTSRMARIKEFAEAERLHFVHKLGDVSLSERLRTLGLIRV